MTTNVELQIRSNSFVYTPGFFKWVEQCREDGVDISLFMDGLGIPVQFWPHVRNKQYTTDICGEDLIIKFNDWQVEEYRDDAADDL